MSTTVVERTLEQTVNAFLLRIGLGTLLAMIVKPRESATSRLELRDKVDLALEESFPASDAPGCYVVLSSDVKPI